MGPVVPRFVGQGRTWWVLDKDSDLVSDRKEFRWVPQLTPCGV